MKRTLGLCAAVILTTGFLVARAEDAKKPAEQKIAGGLESRVIDEHIRKSMPAFIACYQSELKKSKNLAGRVAMNFLIGGDGKVTKATVTSTSMNNPAVENCVAEVIKGIQFPEPVGHGVVEVDYPFSFDPSAKTKKK